VIRLAVLSESPADEEIVRVLVNAALGGVTEIAPRNTRLESRGWPGVRTILPAVMKSLFHGDIADLLVVVIDSNGSTPHGYESESFSKSPMAVCRRCQLETIVQKELNNFERGRGIGRLRVALGLAVPCIEAWLLCGSDPTVNEASWINGMKEGKTPYLSRALKKKVYGTDRPSLSKILVKGVQEAKRVSNALSSLKAQFPNGFGALYRQLVEIKKEFQDS